MKNEWALTEMIVLILKPLKVTLEELQMLWPQPPLSFQYYALSQLWTGNGETHFKNGPIVAWILQGPRSFCMVILALGWSL